MSQRLSTLIILCGLCAVGVPAAQGEHAATAAMSRARLTHGPASTPKARATAPIKVAITLDDMPGGGPEVLGYSHVQMVKDMIAVLQAHRITAAMGFIVGGMIDTVPARFEALDAWVQAGFLVGNHSYSHDHLAELGLSAFMSDITRNRTLVDALEKRTGQEQSYFRFPYLEEGRTPEERRALMQLLARERYTLTRVSVGFHDTDWAGAYLRCQEKGDDPSLRALDRSYLAQAVAHLQWSLTAADHVVGHAIPHILLLHVNVPTAKNLDALLRAYEALGVQFISVEEALREPAYAAYYDAADGDLLSQASSALSRPHPPKPVALDGLIDRVCR
jgi:peptidoglycan/xylan/chitin deacetylase (PgdA/CDA1 family)